MKSKKETVRTKISQLLKDFTPFERNIKSENIYNQLTDVEFFKKSRCVFIYVSLDEEVDTHRIIMHCLRIGKRIAVPRVNSTQGTMEIREIKNWDEHLTKGAYGILEPREDITSEVSPEEVDLAVVPGVAFDRKGYRLGRGKGFYDRFLSRLNPRIPRIGLAFDVQLMDDVPTESHDLPVHTVLSA